MSRRRKLLSIIGLLIVFASHEMTYQEEQATKGIVNYEYSNR